MTVIGLSSVYDEYEFAPYDAEYSSKSVGFAPLDLHRPRCFEPQTMQDFTVNHNLQGKHYESLLRDVTHATDGLVYSLEESFRLKADSQDMKTKLQPLNSTKPIIHCSEALCLTCGQEASASSFSCKKCHELLGSTESELMIKSDLEFLQSLKGKNKKSPSRKRASTDSSKSMSISLECIENRSPNQKREPSVSPHELSPGSKRRRRHDEWTREEIVILLQCTKLLIDCELKCVSQALYHFTSRKPGKCFGRAAEKKLKRLEIFENWRKANKDTVIERVDMMLEHYEAMEIPSAISQYCENLKSTSSNRSLALAKASIKSC